MSDYRSLSFAFLWTGALLLIGCGTDAGPSSLDPVAPPVQVEPAEFFTQAPPIRTSGTLALKAEVPLSFKVGGIVERVLVDEGDTVQGGQEIARIDLSEINAQVLETESALEKARRDSARTQRLYRDSVATLEDIQDARTQVEIAEARTQSARFNRRYAVVEAPESGRILRRTVEEGQLVSPGDPVVVLGAVERGWVVRAGLAARDIVRVQLGDSATVTLDAFPQSTLHARVTEIAEARSPQTGTFEVELMLSAPERTLKSGFIGRVALFSSAPVDAVSIPATALVEGDGSEGIIYTFDDASRRVQRTRVRIGSVLDDRLAIVEGLSPRTSVVTIGASALADGDSVRVIR